ncbi:MAG: extracellular solute-binding protein [Acutalibacter sp.]|jgi:putative aldouronate transport system substrate-binding protein
MKRFLAILLCLSMLVGVMAGCNGGGESSTSDSGSTSSAADTGDSSATEDTSGAGDSGAATSEDGVTNTGTTLPIVNEPVTISVVKERHMLDTTESFNEKAAWKNITDETGITIEWIELAAGTASERVPLMLSSGDLPDVFWAALSDAQVLQNESNLFALEDYMEDFAPNSLATYEQLETDWRQLATTPSGHIYGFLGRYESLKENSGDGIQIINKAWLDKVGLDVPTTLDEFTEVLRAFKEQDPNGNGQADEIPYCFSEDMWCASLTSNMGWWGIGDGASVGSDYLYDKSTRDGVVSGSVNTDEYRAYLEYFHELYAEGLIDAEGFSQNTEVFSTKIKSNQVGTYFCWTALEYLTSEQEKDWVVVPPIQAVEGVEPVANGIQNRSTIQKNKWVITTSCEHPEAAMRLWDYQARDTESKMTVAMGEKGVLWDEYEDGSGYYFIVPENTTPEFTFEHMKYTYGVVNDPPLMTIAETPVNDGEISPSAALRDTMIDQVSEYFLPKEDEMPASYVSTEAIDRRTFIETDLFAYINQFRAQAVMNGFTDDEWNTYVSQLDAYGYQEWLQWYQDLYDGTLE